MFVVGDRIVVVAPRAAELFGQEGVISHVCTREENRQFTSDNRKVVYVEFDDPSIRRNVSRWAHHLELVGDGEE